MIIELDFESEVPIYEQLKTELIVGIASGKLALGERLPSVRQMASDIGINLHTVNKAYKQLQDEGYLLIHRQKGVVVNPVGPPEMTEKDIKQLESLLRPIIADMICRQKNQADLKAITENIFNDLQGGQKDE